jgi:hypothetical protein
VEGAESRSIPHLYSHIHISFGIKRSLPFANSVIHSTTA